MRSLGEVYQGPLVQQQSTVLEAVRSRRDAMQNDLREIDELISLLEKNPDMEKALSLMRRFV